ncbi:MAG: ATP-binding cassette domain-containing protein [Holdemania massiliensis]
MEVLNCDLSIKDPKQPKAFDPAQHGYVEFKDVAFRYPGAEENVVENISFLARPGQTTAFIGSTGSGKSTIVNLVPRFFDVTAGSIEVDGVDIRKSVSRNFGIKLVMFRRRACCFPERLNPICAMPMKCRLDAAEERGGNCAGQ